MLSESKTEIEVREYLFPSKADFLLCSKQLVYNWYGFRNLFAYMNLIGPTLVLTAFHREQARLGNSDCTSRDVSQQKMLE